MRLFAGPTIAAAMAGPDDRLSLVRLALAVAVVVSHGFSMGTGRLRDEPLFASTGFTLGEHAVNGFFALSGFLVTMSFGRRGARDYVVARTLRIAPGLAVATLVTALVLGPALSRLSVGEYLSHPGLWRFIVATLTTLKSAIALPGVFAENPNPLPLGTVWSLKYEVLCYAAVLVLGLAGLLTRTIAAAAVTALVVALVVVAIASPNAPKAVQTTLRLALLFGAGGALWLWRDRVCLSGLALSCLAAAAWLARETPLSMPLLLCVQAYGVIWLALGPLAWLPRLGREVDLSYGIYLYGWPIQQALVQTVAPAGPAMLLPVALALTLVAAALSWFLVEKPALSLKPRFAREAAPMGSPSPAL